MRIPNQKALKSKRNDSLLVGFPAEDQFSGCSRFVRKPSTAPKPPLVVNGVPASCQMWGIWTCPICPYGCPQASMSQY